MDTQEEIKSKLQPDHTLGRRRLWFLPWLMDKNRLFAAPSAPVHFALAVDPFPVTLIAVRPQILLLYERQRALTTSPVGILVQLEII